MFRLPSLALLAFASLLATECRALTRAEKEVVYKSAVRWGQCLLSDYSCNLAVSGVDPTERTQDAAWLLGFLHRRGAIDFDSVLDHPEPEPPRQTGAECRGRGTRARIRLYDRFYARSTPKKLYAVNEQVVMLLHEVGHAAGINHEDTAASDAWNLVIEANCVNDTLLHACWQEFRRLESLGL